MLGSRRQLSGFVCTFLCACFAVPALASAGSYQVAACDSATTANGAASSSTYANNSWVYSPPSDTSMWESFSSCPSSGSGTYSGLGIYDVLRTLGGAPSTAWTFTAPSGTTITNTSINRWIGKHQEPYWRPYGMSDGTIFETCDYDYSSDFGCELTDTYSGDPGNSTVSYGFYCERAGCLNGGTLHAVWVAIYSATITLSESVPPSLSVSSSGFSQSGNLTGTQTVSFSGSDARGIKKAELYVDGSLKATSSNSLCDYTYVNPCADPAGSAITWNSSLSYDVTSLSDGNHTAYVRAYDAADNTTNSDTWSFTTDNTPNTGSGSGTGGETGGGSGSGAETGGGTSGGETGTGTGTGTSTDTGSGSTDSSSDSTGTNSGSSSTGTDTATATKSSANLKLKSAKLKSGRLTVKGTCARHNYTKRFKLSYSPTKGEAVRKSFKCTKGRWSLTLKVGTRSGGKVRASYAGDERIAQGKASKSVGR